MAAVLNVAAAAAVSAVEDVKADDSHAEVVAEGNDLRAEACAALEEEDDDEATAGGFQPPPLRDPRCGGEGAPSPCPSHCAVAAVERR